MYITVHYQEIEV